MKYDTFVFSNGLKLVHQYSDSIVAHCGLIINAGSRDEFEYEHGIAHFIEHLLFKGTKKRKAYQIANIIENAGGEINAYTTKEETCIYTAFLNDDYDRTLDILSDVVFNSTFPQKEIEKEREIIIDEINSYKDSPSELIFDDFEELIFKDSPIARNILGTKTNLKKITRNDILSFMQRNYNTDKMLISSIGNINFQKLIRKVEKYFNNTNCTKSNNDIKRICCNHYKPERKEVRKKTYQAHCIIGNIAYPIKSDKRIGLIILNNLLGGPNMNSKLNMVLREKNGMAYNIESMYHPYSDTGIFAVYFGTDKSNVEKCINLIYKEFDKIINMPLSTQQLKIAKKQLIGQLALASENIENQMLSNGKSYLFFNKVDSIEEIKEKIETFSSNDLQIIANEIFDKEKMSVLIYY
jgi:predicted Zn-dependent peptidase